MLNSELFNKDLEQKISLMNSLIDEDAYCEYEVEEDDSKANRGFNDLIVDDGLRTYILEMGYGICLIHFDNVKFDVLAKTFDCVKKEEESLDFFRMSSLSEQNPIQRGARLIESYINGKLWLSKQMGEHKEKYTIRLAGIGAGNRIAVEIKQKVIEEMSELNEDFSKLCEIKLIDGLTSLQEKIFQTPVTPPTKLGKDTLFQKLAMVYSLPFPERVPFSEYGEGFRKYFGGEEGICCTLIKNHNRRVFESWIPDIVRIKSNLFIGAIKAGKPCGILAATIGQSEIQIDYIHNNKDESPREVCYEMLKMLIEIQEKCGLGQIRINLWDDILNNKEEMDNAVRFLEELGFSKEEKDPFIRYELELENAWKSQYNTKKVESDLSYIPLSEANMKLWDLLEKKIEESAELDKLDSQRLSARSYNTNCTMLAVKEGALKGAMLVGGKEEVYWIHRVYSFDMKPTDILFMTQLVIKRIHDEATGKNVKLLLETKQKERGEYFKQYANGKAITTAISYIKS